MGGHVAQRNEKGLDGAVPIRDPRYVLLKIAKAFTGGVTDIGNPLGQFQGKFLIERHKRIVDLIDRPTGRVDLYLHSFAQPVSPVAGLCDRAHDLQDPLEFTIVGPLIAAGQARGELFHLIQGLCPLVPIIGGHDENCAVGQALDLEGTLLHDLRAADRDGGGPIGQRRDPAQIQRNIGADTDHRNEHDDTHRCQNRGQSEDGAARRVHRGRPIRSFIPCQFDAVVHASFLFAFFSGHSRGAPIHVTVRRAIVPEPMTPLGCSARTCPIRCGRRRSSRWRRRTRFRSCRRPG